MLFFRRDPATKTIVAVSETYPTGDQWLTREWSGARDCEDIQEATALALAANELTEPGRYIPIDRGRNVSPRYDVMMAPMVGEEVSKGFNGDYYPCGTIVAISPTMKKITTSDGTVFYRKRENSPRWSCDGTFCLVRGRIDERNPSF